MAQVEPEPRFASVKSQRAGCGRGSSPTGRKRRHPEIAGMMRVAPPLRPRTASSSGGPPGAPPARCRICSVSTPARSSVLSRAGSRGIGVAARWVPLSFVGLVLGRPSSPEMTVIRPCCLIRVAWMREIRFSAVGVSRSAFAAPSAGLRPIVNFGRVMMASGRWLAGAVSAGRRRR